MLVPPAGMAVGANALMMLTVRCTLRLSEAAPALVTLFALVIAPAGSVLV